MISFRTRTSTQVTLFENMCGMPTISVQDYTKYAALETLDFDFITQNEFILCLFK